MRNFELKKLDAITTFADKFDYNFNCKKNTELFIISSENLKQKNINLYILILKGYYGN